MESVDLNTGYLSKEYNELLQKHLNNNSVAIPYLYNGDLKQIEKAIEALEYLFNKSYESNCDDETRTRLSQMGGIYLTPIIVELKEYKKQLEKIQKIITLSSKKEENFKPIYLGKWYEEYKKGE